MIIYTKVNWSNIMWDMKNLSSWLTVNAFWFRPPLVKPHRVHVCDKSSVYCPDQALQYTYNLIALLFTCTTVHHCQKFHCLTKSIVTVIQVLCFTCTSTFFNNHGTSKWYEIWCIILKFKLSETFELNILVTRNILNDKKYFELLLTYTCIWHIHYSLVEHLDAKNLQKTLFNKQLQGPNYQSFILRSYYF